MPGPDMQARRSDATRDNRENHALAAAIRHVNVSTPLAIDEASLLRAIEVGDVPPGLGHHVHAFIDETDTATLSDIVTSGVATYGQLARLADRLLPDGHDTRRWLDGRRDL